MPARFVDLYRQTPMFLPYDLHVSHRQQAGVQGSVCERVATGPASAFEQDWHGQRGWHEAQANASKHAAVSYARAGEMIAQLELEVQELVGRAQQADYQAKQARRQA